MREIAFSSSVLILAVLCVRALAGGRVPMRLRYALWLPVLVRLLLPFSLPGSPLSVLNAVEPPAAEVRISLPGAGWTPEDLPAGQGTAEPGGAAPAAGEAGPAASTVRAVPLWTALGWVWLAGSCLTGAGLLWANLRLLRRLRGAEPVQHQDCPVPVLLAEGLPSPCLAGVFRPRIYLTQKSTESETTLRHVLTHELCHLRHGDCWWALLRLLCMALWWWNPLVWLAAALSRRDGELACDEAAVAALGEGERIPYGETLLALVGRRNGPGTLLGATTAMAAGKGAMRERIARLAGRKKAWLPLCAAAVLLVGLAAVCTFTGPGAEVSLPAEPDPPAGPATPAPQVEEITERTISFLLVGLTTPEASPDTLIAVRFHYDEEGAQLNAISIPRDTKVDVPWDIQRINTVYSSAGGGEAGAEALRRAASELLGTDLTHTFVVDQQAVAELVDAMEGVEFDVPVDMNYDDPAQDLHIRLEKGPQVLDGNAAMALLRFRKNNDNSGYENGDAGRMEVQRTFLRAVAEQCLEARSYDLVVTLVNLFKEHVQTDMSASFLELMCHYAIGKGVEFNLFPMPGDYGASGWSETYSNYQSYVEADREALDELVKTYF